MRSVAYGAAILAAAGIMYFITMTPSEPATDATTETAASAESGGSIVPDADVQTASLTMSVPKMHCPVMCYPSVKKSLEERDDVLSVELAPQKEEGIIDNRQVIVTYKTGFDTEQAIASLETVGFPGSSVVGE
jgi:mercuric ion binding protein